MGERLVWWLAHDATAPSVLIQSAAAVLTTVITAALCGITYKYMLLTQQLAKMAHEQVTASVRPVIELRLNFQGDQDKFGQPFFKDEIVVEITNAGAVPVVLQDVIVEWKHSDAVGLLSSHINSFAGVVLAPGVKRLGVLHALHNGAPPTVKPLGAFADFVRVQVKCSDIGRLAPLAFQFQQATGLTLPSADKLIS